MQASTISTSRVRLLSIRSDPQSLITTPAENYMLEDPSWKNDIIPEIMEGHNIFDFIDPDIEEKLEALEREEEKLEAEGFYASDEEIVGSRSRHKHTLEADVLILQIDSSDERFEEEARIASEYKKRAQDHKKTLKNKAIMPRTAGLRTLSEMTDKLTAAGYDPSRIQARAEMLAKVQGAKRKREQEEMDVDMDEGEWSDEAEDDDMDVDSGNVVQKAKRTKTNTGAAMVKKHQPASNRQLAGMRNEEVSRFACTAGDEWDC